MQRRDFVKALAAFPLLGGCLPKLSAEGPLDLSQVQGPQGPTVSELALAIRKFCEQFNPAFLNFWKDELSKSGGSPRRMLHCADLYPALDKLVGCAWCEATKIPWEKEWLGDAPVAPVASDGRYCYYPETIYTPRFVYDIDRPFLDANLAAAMMSQLIDLSYAYGRLPGLCQLGYADRPGVYVYHELFELGHYMWLPTFDPEIAAVNPARYPAPDSLAAQVGAGMDAINIPKLKLDCSDPNPNLWSGKVV